MMAEVLVGGGEEGDEEGGAGDEVFDEDVFVGCVGAFADSTHAVEGGDTEGGGEVSVGASSGGGFVEVEAEGGGELAGLFEEGNGAGFALHRWAVDASGDAELAVGVGDFEVAEELFYVGGVGGFGDADVDFCVGVGGNDVGARSAGDDAAVDGEFAAEIGEAGEDGDETGEF